MERMVGLNRTSYIPFIGVPLGPDVIRWERIDKTTIFTLELNPEIANYKYIDSKIPENIITNYKPTIAQEIELIEGNGAYNILFATLYNLAVGENCRFPFLLCFGGAYNFAWLTEATLVVSELNAVERKIKFKINIDGDIKRGMCDMSSGEPVFKR